MDAEADFKAAIGAPADADLTTKSVWTWPIEKKEVSRERAHVRVSRDVAFARVISAT